MTRHTRVIAATLGVIVLAQVVISTEVKKSKTSPVAPYGAPAQPGLFSGIGGLILGKNALLLQRPLLALGQVAQAVGNGANRLAARVTQAGLSGFQAASQSLGSAYAPPAGGVPGAIPLGGVPGGIGPVGGVPVGGVPVGGVPVGGVPAVGGYKGHHSLHHRSKGQQHAVHHKLKGAAKKVAKAVKSVRR